MDNGTAADTSATTEVEQPREFDRTARPWLDAIEDARAAFQSYHERCDNIDKLYANLNHLAGQRADRELQIFWGNMEVLRPSIYSRPPIPVVVPSFRDRDELARKASEVLERTLITSFRTEDIHDDMLLVRDDMAAGARGALWLRYENDGESERVCYDHVDRQDFLHEPARKWKEVGWVARRAYLSMEEGRQRFGDEFLQCKFQSQTIKGQDWKGEKKAEVWELWSKTKNLVVWVSPGVDDVLDIQPPFLSLDGFFPCPRPAYGTIQRGSLIPVPDFLYYKDQLEEINELTARMSALCESLKLRGFYPSGEETISGAVERAMKSQDNAAILIPVPAFAMAQGQSLKDAVLWLPVVEVANTIKELIVNRQQLIQDVYQVTGLSDIMRGSTDPNETLGAQKLKSQYGSIRIREKQSEIVRIIRDATRLAAEIMAENFAPETFAKMSLVQIPLQPAPPQMVQPGAPPPKPVPTMTDIVNLFRQDRMRTFVLDIETDSTIQPDEEGEKERRMEFMTAAGGFFREAVPLVQAVPEAAPLAIEMLKFVAGAFRAGRPLEGAIEDFGQKVEAKAAQPPPKSPDQMKAENDMAIANKKAETDQARASADIEIKRMDMALKEKDMQLKEMDLRIKAIESDARMHECAVNKEKMTREAMQPEDQPDELDQETKRVGIEKTRADVAKTYSDIEHAKHEREQSTRKVTAEADDAENRAKHSQAIADVADRLIQAVDKLDVRQQHSEEMLTNLVKAINAPRRIVRDPKTGRASHAETVM